MPVREHAPLRYALTFFGLSFAISWIPGLVVAAVLQALLPDSMDRASLLLAKYGPTIAGLVMAAAVFGRRGVEFLLRSAFRVRVHVLWYVFVLLVPFGMWAAALLAFEVAGGDVDWRFIDDLTPTAPLAALATFTFLGGGLGEELGWRGFALPMLQRQVSALQASLIVGFAWAAWHYPALLLDRESNTTPIWLFTVFVLAATILMTWMYNSTRGNVLLAVLFHASFNASESLTDGAVSAEAESGVEMWLAALYLFVGLLILVIYSPSNLSRRTRTTWPNSDEAGAPEPPASRAPTAEA